MNRSELPTTSTAHHDLRITLRPQTFSVLPSIIHVEAMQELAKMRSWQGPPREEQKQKRSPSGIHETIANLTSMPFFFLVAKQECRWMLAVAAAHKATDAHHI